MKYLNELPLFFVFVASNRLVFDKLLTLIKKNVPVLVLKSCDNHVELSSDGSFGAKCYVLEKKKSKYGCVPVLWLTLMGKHFRFLNRQGSYDLFFNHRRLIFRFGVRVCNCFLFERILKSFYRGGSIAVRNSTSFVAAIVNLHMTSWVPMQLRHYVSLNYFKIHQDQGSDWPELSWS